MSYYTFYHYSTAPFQYCKVIRGLPAIAQASRFMPYLYKMEPCNGKAGLWGLQDN